jgi:DNA-binding NarL/FixJ family response regulator
MEARASETLIGRVRELEVLEAALEAAEAEGSTILVAGEAGIGKTHLVSELSRRARERGFDTLLGRSIDLVGTELPYQPFVEALRPIADPRQPARAARSQLEAFDETLAVLTERAASNPVLLVLEDLHWADASTLDLFVFLAHNLADQPLLLVGTCRTEDAASRVRIRRLADGVRRSDRGLVLEVGPLEQEAVATLVEMRTGATVPATLVDDIVERSEGNPFFAEELLAASQMSGELPIRLRDLLLQRIVRLDRPSQDLLRVAAAVGRDVGYPVLAASAELPKPGLDESLRRAVEEGVLVVDAPTGSFRFRHALLAEAVYETILPGERVDVHARLAKALTHSDAARPAELAPHWAAAGRPTEALTASVEAAREAQDVFAPAEALSHLDRALDLWDAVPDAREITMLDFAELLSWAAEIASQTGAAPRAVELARAALALVEDDPLRAATVHRRLGRYLHESGRTDEALTAFERVVELVPDEPSRERADALLGLATGLMLAWRFDDSRPVAESALALARSVGSDETEMRALEVLGRDLAYLGQADEGLTLLRHAVGLAERSGDPLALLEVHVALTDVLTMLGRPAESARIGEAALETLRPFGIDRTVLVSNYVEALLAIGEWDEAARASAAALRRITANFPYMLLGIQADLELGRGQFERARAHFEEGLTTLREDRGQGIYDVYFGELALWEHRWTDAFQHVSTALELARSRQAAQLRVWFCAKGLRALAELAALARARRDTAAAERWAGEADELIALARAAASDASSVTPNAAGWLALAEAEHERASGVPGPDAWSRAAAAWDTLERPPLAAYCRWREAESLVAAGASKLQASEPLRDAYAVAVQVGAAPLIHELELLAQRARLDLASRESHAEDAESLETVLGLTPREAEVLTLVARGRTNREIAAELVISVKTASVHVSHILRKLGASNRREAAAIAHRVAPPS